MSFLDRFPRRTTMLGGPLDGEVKPLPIPTELPWPPFRCHRQGGGPWQHYRLERVDGDTAATYRYVGECDADNHEGRPLPHEHRCCCGRTGCDGREIR